MGNKDLFVNENKVLLIEYYMKVQMFFLQIRNMYETSTNTRRSDIIYHTHYFLAYEYNRTYNKKMGNEIVKNVKCCLK